MIGYGVLRQKRVKNGLFLIILFLSNTFTKSRVEIFILFCKISRLKIFLMQKRYKWRKNLIFFCIWYRVQIVLPSFKFFFDVYARYQILQVLF